MSDEGGALEKAGVKVWLGGWLGWLVGVVGWFGWLVGVVGWLDWLV